MAHPLGFLSLLTLQLATAAPLPPRRERPVPPAARAVRAEPRAPRLDGRLDDPAWATAPAIGDFTQRTPDPGSPASERTEARVVYSDAAIYVGVRAWDSHAADILGQLTRRDIYSESDWIGVHIDSYRDRRTAFEFAVNAAGVRLDLYRYNDVDADQSWDAVWEVVVARDSAGWTAEFRIPFSQLRFSGAAAPVFGFNVERRIKRLNEIDFWHPVPPDSSAFVSRYGDLVGLEQIHAPHPVEIQPYVLSGAGTAGFTGTAGADLKAGLTSSATLSAAINPDFGQVEADPATVNLSAFETYLAEQRSFFTEGVDLFRFAAGISRTGNEQLFYSRRIGRAPQLQPDARGGTVDRLSPVRILGAAKLAGKTAGGWTFGGVGAVTEAERASGADSLGFPFRELVEPRTTYLAGRLGRTLRAGQTTLGLFGTAVRRDLDPRSDTLRRGAYALGLEFRHRFRHDTYSLTGMVAASRVLGSAAAIAATERSAVHFFQRPDDHIAFDSTRTSLSGATARLRFEKHGGGAWLWSTTAITRTPGFEVNDLGFQYWAGQTYQDANVTRRWLTPGRVFRSLDVRLAEFAFWDWSGRRINWGGNVVSNMVWANSWTGYLSFWWRAGGFDPAPLRGGPGLAEPGNWYTSVSLATDGRARLQAELTGEAWAYPGVDYGGAWINPTLRWRPSPRHEVAVGPRLERGDEDRHLLATASVNGRVEYIVGDLRQRTTALTLRGSATFTQNLSLQLYAEPFVSTGRYPYYQRVLDPRSTEPADQFDRFGADRVSRDSDGVAIDVDRDGVRDVSFAPPEFTVVSLRANAVLRWEYRPGSTLFVVWQHGRSGDRPSALGLRDATSLLGRTAGENRLLVKVSYWLSLH